MQPLEERLRRRAQLIRSVRTYFDQADFIEVDTPIALTAPAPELHIEAPEVTFNLLEAPQRRFLQTSPELPMKRLLSLGLPRIYQIASVFRDGDYSPCHRPEFRMLEWYRRDASWETLFTDCEGLMRTLAQLLCDGPLVKYQGTEINLAPPFRRVTVEEAFVEHAGFSILNSLTLPTLQRELTKLNLAFGGDDRWDDLFHRVFLSLVEPRLLDHPRPLFLTQYPAPLGALARLSPEDPRVAERVELYCGGMELANGFGELTSPTEQRSRFEAERQKRRDAGSVDYPLDERFLDGLTRLPPSAGMALGIDRLVMLFLDLPTIEESGSLPWSET